MLHSCSIVKCTSTANENGKFHHTDWFKFNVLCTLNVYELTTMVNGIRTYRKVRRCPHSWRLSVFHSMQTDTQTHIYNRTSWSVVCQAQKGHDMGEYFGGWVCARTGGKRHAGMIIKHFHSIWIENRYVCPVDTTPLPPSAYLRNT